MLNFASNGTKIGMKMTIISVQSRGQQSRKMMTSRVPPLNGLSSHTFDYDDTLLKTIIHPAGPAASAALAVAEHMGASVAQLIDAMILGICARIRNWIGVSPSDN